MSETNNIETLLEKVNLNWSVRTEELITTSGIILENNKAIVRDDNNLVLSVRGKDYHPYQNKELVELLDRVSGLTGLEVARGGFFGNGEKVFIQLKSENLRLGNDLIEGYLTGINSFDGSTSLAFGPSNVTISCQNKFFAAFREMDTKVRHTKNMVMKVDEICRGLEGVLKEEKKVFDSIVQLSETRFDDVMKDDFIKKLFNVDKKVDLQDTESISTVTRNKLNRFYVDLNGELKDKGDNMWGLFSGITKYTTHSLNKDSNRSDEKMYNVYGKRELSIFNNMVELV
jgi:phage/plasmid-like protein (TIGR03299 family)